MKFALFEHFQLVIQQPQSLHRIHGMHGLFNRQMDIKVLDQNLRLLDQGFSLIHRKVALIVCHYPKIRNRLYRSQNMAPFGSRYFHSHLSLHLISYEFDPEWKELAKFFYA